jgi:hypothetical protein
MVQFTPTKEQQEEINAAVSMMRAINGLSPLDIHNINKESTRIFLDKVGYLYEKSPLVASKEELKPLIKKLKKT